MSEISIQIAENIQAYLRSLETARLRIYEEPWSEWENSNPGSHEYPVIYALWSADKILQYVGKTTNLGKRLSEHFRGNYWNPEIKYASFYETSDFIAPEILSVAEAYAIASLKPPQNAETWEDQNA